MIKKCVCFTFICLLLITANSSFVTAQTANDDSVSTAAKIKAAVLKRGTGENKRVEVKKTDGTKLKGYISQSGEDSFTLTDSKTNQTSVITYGDVAKLKNRSSRGDKIALGIIVGAIAGVAIVLGSIISIRCKNEGGC